MNQLTPQERIRIFADHLGCSVIHDDGELATLVGVEYTSIIIIHAGTGSYGKGENIGSKLILTPLGMVYDVDKIAIAEFCYTNEVSTSEKLQIGQDYIDYNILDKAVPHYRTEKLGQFDSVHLVHIFQYLSSRNYDVPLFFLPGHWANNKTAIDLGVAISSKTFNQQP